MSVEYRSSIGRLSVEHQPIYLRICVCRPTRLFLRFQSRRHSADTLSILYRQSADTLPNIGRYSADKVSREEKERGIWICVFSYLNNYYLFYRSTTTLLLYHDHATSPINDSRPIARRQFTDSLPIVHRYVTDRSPTLSTDNQTLKRKISAEYRSSIDRMLVECRSSIG